MAAGFSALEELEGFIRYKETEKATHEQLKDELQAAFPENKGFSVSLIQKFCAKKKIKRTTDIDDQHLDETVSQVKKITDAHLKLSFCIGWAYVWS